MYLIRQSMVSHISAPRAAAYDYTMFNSRRPEQSGQHVADDSFKSIFLHYSDVILSTMASKITSVLMACTTVCSGADQRKHQSSVSLFYYTSIVQICRMDLISWCCANKECLRLVNFTHKFACTTALAMLLRSINAINTHDWKVQFDVS